MVMIRSMSKIYMVGLNTWIRITDLINYTRAVVEVYIKFPYL